MRVLTFDVPPQEVNTFTIRIITSIKAQISKTVRLSDSALNIRKGQSCP